MPGLARATREGYFATFRQLLDWAVGRGIVPSNPAIRVNEGRKVASDQRKYRAFTPAQLRSIFSAPLFTGCADEERGAYTPGPHQYRNGRFWVPLLGLFTGARLGELCQLRAKDVYVSEKGTPYIRLHAEEKGMSLKNENSWRTFPIHPELQRIGFLKFVTERQEGGVLFPELLVEGRMAGYRMSKLFSYFLTTLGIKQRGVTFHSFRHTFRDALRLANVEVEIAERLAGWSNNNRTSSHYGEGHTMDQMAAEMAKVR